MRFLLTAISITLFLLAACSAPENPTFKKLENVKFNSLSIKKPYSVTLNADAIFHNPNVLGAQISAMDFDVYINGQKSTHIRQEVSTKMGAKADFTLPIICTVPLKDVFKDLKLKDLLKSPEVKYQLIGHLTVDLGGIGIKVPITYEGMERLRI